jgi:CHAT domain-containing protein
MILLPELRRDGASREEEFLSLRYRVTRWTESYSPAPVIRLRNLIYVAPQYKSARQLASASAEVDYLESLQAFGVQPKSVRAQPVPVFDSFDMEPFDCFHFVGHASQTTGEQVDYSTLELETEEVTVGDTLKSYAQILEPIHVLGKAPKWGPRRPLVFLNACQTGRKDIGLARPAGWARAFLGSKAGAFVGTLWSVRDEGALRFSTTFYDALRAGETFGESALRARREVAGTRDPSWLAYVVYAHPNARVVFGREGQPAAPSR